MSLVSTQPNKKSSYPIIVQWANNTLTQSSVTFVTMGNKIAKRNELQKERKNVKCTWTGRRACSGTLHSSTTWRRQRRPSVRPGQGIRVAMVARPTASKRWRLDRKHGRRRPAAGVITTEQQRPVRQLQRRSLRLLWLLSFTTGTATRAQFQSHCVSVIHINRLTDYYDGP